MNCDLKVPDVPNIENFSSQDWKDDCKVWPPVTYDQIKKHVIESLAIDASPAEAFKSLDGFNYYHSGWVDTVFAVEVDDTHVYVRGKVSGSQALNKEHEAWILLKQTGDIMDARCTCMAGAARTCSHVAAILCKLDHARQKGLSGKSVTDEKSKWNRTTKKTLHPQKISEISFKKFKYYDDNEEIDTPGQKKNLTYLQFYDHAEFVNHYSSCKLKNLIAVSQSPLKAALQAEPQPRVLETINISNRIHGTHEYLEPISSPMDSVLCVVCNEFFKSHIKLQKNQISLLSLQTVGQSKSPLWEEVRKIRLTASTASKVPKKKSTAPDNFLRSHITPDFKGNSSTKHGNISEPKAIRRLEQICSKNISPCGLFVSEKDPWLSASPDGIIDDEITVEVKCPVTSSLKELYSSGKYDVGLTEGNEPYLKKTGNRGFYTQIQLTLFCTERKECFLFIWRTDEDSTFLSIQFDPVFVDKELNRLRLFYAKHFIPHVIKLYKTNMLKLFYYNKFLKSEKA